MHDDDVATGLLDLAEQVGGEEDRRAACRDPQQGLTDLDYLSRVEPVDRLVQDEQFRLSKERLSEAEPLAHPMGVSLHLPVSRRAETGDLQRLL